MGLCVYLVCDECRTIAFVCKWFPLKDRLRVDNLEDFFSYHYDDDIDGHCTSSFKLLTENQMTEDQFDYESINNPTAWDNLTTKGEV